MNRKNVGILLFENIEVLDFCGPFEVFSITRLNEDKRREELSPFHAFLVAETKQPIAATGGMRVLPDFDLNDCPELDVLVVPGGLGTRHEMNNERLLGWIADRSRQVETMASVCTGAMLLGKAGLLDGKRATTLASSGVDARTVSEDPGGKGTARRRRRFAIYFCGYLRRH